MTELTTSRTGVVRSLDDVRRTPLDRIPIAQANAIVEQLLSRRAAEKSVEVARFGSFI